MVAVAPSDRLAILGLAFAVVAQRLERERVEGEPAAAPSADDAQLRDLVQLDLGQAAMSIMLAAADLGIGSAHAGVQDQDLARRLLGVPKDRLCALLITLGVPADRPLAPIQRPDRRPFEDVVHRGHW